VSFQGREKKNFLENHQHPGKEARVNKTIAKGSRCPLRVICTNKNRKTDGGKETKGSADRRRKWDRREK